MQHSTPLRQAVRLGIVVDAKTGFDGPVDVHCCVRMLGRIGANAIPLGDQVVPKPSGHFTGQAELPAAEMAANIRASVDACRRDELMSSACADACAADGNYGAIEATTRCAQAGADVTFVEAPGSLMEIERIASEPACPQKINVVVGGKPPFPAGADFARLRFGMVLCTNAVLRRAVR